jgi:hypothetical protein
MIFLPRMVAGGVLQQDDCQRKRAGLDRPAGKRKPAGLALQLPFMSGSESMGNHDSEIVDAGRVD